MQEFWEEHNRKIVEIEQRTKRHIRILFICGGVFLAGIIYWRFFY
jgi:hypothetical protein